MESISCPLTPKSQSLISPLEFTKMLDGLTSGKKKKRMDDLGDKTGNLPMQGEFSCEFSCASLCFPPVTQFWPSSGNNQRFGSLPGPAHRLSI